MKKTFLLLAFLFVQVQAQFNAFTYNSIRVSYFCPDQFAFASVGDQFIKRAEASKYNYIVVPFSFRISDQIYGNGDVYANLQADVAAAFIKTRGTGVRLIPQIQMNSQWSLGWDIVRQYENWNITITKFSVIPAGENSWQLRGTNCWANEPYGIDKSFIDVLNAVKRGYFDAQVGYPLEFVHLGHDEPQVVEYSIVGQYPYKDQFSLCYWTKYSIELWMANNPDNAYLGGKLETLGPAGAVQDLMSNEIFRRVTQVQSVFGPNTKVMIYGDSWDAGSWGGVYMWQYFYSTNSRYRIKIAPGILNLPGLSENQKNTVRKNLILVPWNYNKKTANRAILCLSEGDYSAYNCFSEMANAGLNFIYCTSVNAEDKNSDAAKRYQSASLSFRNNCLGYFSAAWVPYTPANTAADYNTMEVLYQLNQGNIPAADFKFVLLPALLQVLY